MLVIKVLGPLTVERDSMKVPLNAPMLRRVLATLAANANRLVPIDSLIAALWSDAAPAGARKTVQIYVHRLRAALGGQLSIGQEAGGYRLTATPVELDSMHFTDLATKGRDHLRQGKQREAADLLGKALTLWRGPAYEDMGELPSVLDHARRLDEARLRVFTEWIEARLDLGHQEDLIPELVGEVEKHPYREDLCGLLMLALYRSGRQSEALDVFRKTRQTLVDDLGIEPGPSLRKLHESVLRSAPELELVAPDDKPMVIPRELPAGTAGFTGRADQLASLDLILKNPSQNSVSIALITGAGGVGKTALTLHWAHQAAKHFPDGQLFVDLRGYAAGTRMRPTEVLTAFLRSLGVPPRRIPIDVNEAAALYRSQVAGRRMLVVLDNARSPNDVRMLLPGTTGCLVLVTSRDRLGGLVAREGATRVSLDVLPPGDAHSLIGRLLDDSRAAPAAARALASACAYLPLALRIAVAHLLDRPHLTATELAARLRDGNRLRQLAISGDETMAVRKTFELSYRSIPEDAQLVFRRLGVVPCHDFTAESVAALAEQTQDVGEQLLDLLCDAHLVSRTADGRYVMHDLLREYASELCKTEDSAAAIGAAANRLQESFLARLCAANRMLYPSTVRLPAPHWAKDVTPFGNKDLALAWLDAEHRNVVAVIQAATSISDRSNAWLLADRLRGYLDMRRQLAHWLGAARAGLLAARAAKDEMAMASMFHMLAHAYGSVGKYGPALKNLERAVALSKSCGWKEGLAMALGNVGVVQGLVGKPEAAEPMFIQALELWREIGRVEPAAKNLHNLATTRWQMGQLDLAKRYCEEAMEATQGAGITYYPSFSTFGKVMCLQGHYDVGLSSLARSVSELRAVGNRPFEAHSQIYLSDAYLELGRLEEARELATNGLRTARDIHQPGAVVDSLTSLALYMHAVNDDDAAERLLEEAVEIATHAKTKFELTTALTAVARAQLGKGNIRKAADSATRSYSLAIDGRFRICEAEALLILATVQHHDGHQTEAISMAERALKIALETGYRFGEAEAHGVLAALYADAGRAAEHAEAAARIYQQTGARPPRALLSSPHLADHHRDMEGNSLNRGQRGEG